MNKQEIIWSVKEGASPYDPFQVTDERGRVVANVLHDPQKRADLSIDEARSFASLIAAAPSLRCALRDCIEWLESVPGGLGEAARASVLEAKRAIREAGGQIR